MKIMSGEEKKKYKISNVKMLEREKNERSLFRTGLWSLGQNEQ
jgi:hypothetical protein